MNVIMPPHLHRLLNRCILQQKRPTVLQNQVISTTVSSSPLPEVLDGKDGPVFKSYKDLHQFSLCHSDEFWGKVAKHRLKWRESFHTVQQCNMDKGEFAWFLGGKLNIAENCIDRHAAEDPDRVALIWEKDEPKTHEMVTYSQLLKMTSRLANVLKGHGIKKGDRVAIYMPNSPLSVAAMLACMRIGAMHSVVFAGFSSDALAARIQDAQCKAVITTDQAVRGGKIIELKETVDAAVKSCPSVNSVFVAKRTGASVSTGRLDVPLDQLMEQASDDCPIEILDSEDPSFMLYTSGSTGKPKGIQHSTAGYILYASLTHKMVFNYSPGDIYACVADIGWITGHSYVVYGPLSNGATSVLFESIPTYPDPGRYWEMIERLKINQFYTAPTAIRLLLKAGDEWPHKYDLSSLRTLGCVGEPLNHEAWHWYNTHVGNEQCDVVDTWWQTETGGICLTPRPSEPGASILPGMPMRPFLGINPAILGPDNRELTGGNVKGSLCIKQPWPGMARTIYGDHNRFLATYLKPYPGYYFSGDGAQRHEDGNYQITGRTDDVINVSGHRLGTAEIEDAMDEHEDVAETAVIGVPHDIKGEVMAESMLSTIKFINEVFPMRGVMADRLGSTGHVLHDARGIYAFVVMKDHAREKSDSIKSDLKTLVATGIAKFAVPDTILVVPGLPKTRSGKIMRRILRKVAVGETDLGDITTLADPAVVEELVKLHASNVISK